MFFAKNRLLNTIWLGIGFAVIAVALHFGGFSAPMYCDSIAYIQENTSVFARESVLDVIKIYPSRPVTMLSFYGDYLVAGMSATYFRLVSSILLAATALALFFLVLLLLKIPALEGISDKTINPYVALFCSLVFLVHPVQSQVVIYIWQRMALLACLFYLLSLAMYLATRLRIIRSKILGFLGAGVLFVCAVFSKENAATLLAVILLIEVILFRQSLRTAMKFVAIVVVAALMVIAAFVVTEKLPGSEEAGAFHLIKLYYRISGLTPIEVALTQSRMFFDYLSLLLAPFWFDMPFWVAPVISRSLFNPPSTALAIGGVFALMGLSLALIRRRPLASFGIFFFILNLIPESALVPSHIFFAYRAILPLVGLTLVAADLGLAALKWANKHGQKGRVQMGLAALLAIWVSAAAVTTASRALIWTDPVLVWEEAARHLPPADSDYDRMHYVAILDSLGFELQQKGRHKEAVQYHELSLKMYPSNMRGLTFMATALAGSGNPGNSEVYFKTALEARATDGRAPVFARTMYGDFLERRARKPEAADQYAEALKIRPDMASLQKKLGALRMELGQAAEAEKCFRKALALDLHAAEAHYDLAAALKTQGKLDEAIRHYQAAVRLKPDYAWAHNNLGRALEEKGDLFAALTCYAKALQYDKNLAEAHFNMGNALTGMNKLDDSIRHYKAAITIRPDYSQAHNNVAAVLEEKGDLRLAAEHYRVATQLRPDMETFAKNLARVMNKLQQ